MNFLAHHAVAQCRAAGGAHGSDPKFFVGNVLPDLIAMSGESRIRPRSRVGKKSPLIAGIELHHETDAKFHSSTAFVAACRDAKGLLVAAPFAEAPKRVFFLTHVLVEIALDRYLLERRPGLALDLYAQFELANLPAVVAEVRGLLDIDRPLTGLTDVLERFVRHRFIFDYATTAGCAGALHRICRRAGLAGFPDDEALTAVAGVFDDLSEVIDLRAIALLGTDYRASSVVQ